MSESKSFDLGSVLTVATGILLTELGNVYAILNYMTGDDLMTHQLPRALDSCGPAVIGQHPELAGVKMPDAPNRPDVEAWVAEQAKQFGTHLDVVPLAWWVPRDPIAELRDMRGDKPIIVVSR